jgi:hypothetical protein
MKKTVVALAMSVLTFSPMISLGEETVGCPHDVGKGKFKPRFKLRYLQAEETYSDEVWKALRGSSPYSREYDDMVDLPHGWHQRLTKVAFGLEYGIIDRLSAGVFLPYVTKDVRRQVWSKEAGKPAWKEIEDDGLEDIWFAVKYQMYSKPPVWEDGGIFVAVGYKPSISSDANIKNGVGTGTDDFKVAVLAHPYFTDQFFLCSDAWYHYRGEVKDIEGFAKSEWDLGDRFGYRAFLGYEFADHKFAVIGGPTGWIAGRNEDRDGQRLEDSDTYSHGFVVKFRWQPFGDEELGSIDIGVNVPYATKTPFTPEFVPFIGGRIKF